ncbi:MAG: helix-hairpin-helix domain-containing protein [Sandaracinaceae bacterium]|nr:helix-hairpin-helix domain-containing protein [Sandaracinaceae bacterium]
MAPRPSAPLAALGALLAALAIATLARPAEEPPPPVPEPPVAVPRTPERRRLLAEEPIDVNAAGAEDLQLLPRIGPRLAERIIAERDRGGRFDSVDALTRVRGIGPRTVERLRPLVTVSP